MTIGKRELRQMLTAVLRLEGQTAGWGRTVRDQSSERISSPSSPPPEKIWLAAAEVWRTTFPAALILYPRAQSYQALADRLLTRRNCFVRKGCGNVRRGIGMPKKKANSGERKVPKKAAARRPKASPKATRVVRLDLSKFPAESVTQMERGICLACVWEVFTRHLKLAPKTALGEIRRYTPSLNELNAAALARPYVALEDQPEPCPYCRSAAKWIARLPIYRIESGKATDALRRELVKSLAKKDDAFVVLEQKATQQHAFFEWLESISKQLDLDDPGWIREVSRHYLSRKEPKVDWPAEFERAHSIRRSRRLEEGREVDNGRLFLAPMLFDELLLVQYLV